jgi:adenylate cyclase
MEVNAALHGDVFGYSAMIADDEAATIRTLRSHRDIIENAVEGFGGEMASFTGDEFLAVFPSARNAVEAAIQIQREHAVQNLLVPQGRQMRFRLGIHAGLIKRDEDGWYGDVVNIAARLQAEADPGGVTISAEAYEQAGDLHLPSEALGLTRLKNIPEPVASYRLIDDQLPDARSRLDRRHSPTHGPSLAVLPFLNLGDPEDGHFATGLMMSLLVELATIPGLDVISENSTLQLDTDGTSDEATSLGSKYILEGAVQREGDQVRVTARLLETATSRYGPTGLSRESGGCSLRRTNWYIR